MTTRSDEAKNILGKKDGGNNDTAQASVPKTMKGMKTTGIHGLIDMYKLQIAQAVPKHVTPERIIQIATTVISRNPSIQKCTTSSIIGAVMQSAILGLDPTPALGQCAFVPYFNSKAGSYECQYMTMYQGYIQLARRSGSIETVYAYVVYENDHFNYELGLNPKLEHRPLMEGDRGNRRFVYSVWKFKDGGYHFQVMSKEQVLKRRAVSKASSKKESPWNVWEDEMWCKTAILASKKYVPLSIEMQQAVASDESTLAPEMYKGGALDLNLLPEHVNAENVEEVEVVEDPPKEEKKTTQKTEEKTADDSDEKIEDKTGNQLKTESPAEMAEKDAANFEDKHVDTEQVEEGKLRHEVRKQMAASEKKQKPDGTKIAEESPADAGPDTPKDSDAPQMTTGQSKMYIADLLRVQVGNNPDKQKDWLEENCEKLFGQPDIRSWTNVSELWLEELEAEISKLAKP